MSAKAKSLEEALLDLVVDQATGGLEAKGDRRRWQFFLNDGQVVCSRSNLKSEQDATLKESLGEVSTQELAQAQLTKRIRNVCTAKNLDWKFHAGARAPHQRPANVYQALIDGLAGAREATNLRTTLSAFSKSWPKVSGDLGTLELAPEHLSFLEGLDGTRSFDQVIGSDPAQKTRLAAIWLTHRLDLVVDGGASDGVMPLTNDDLDMDLDISAMIAEELGEESLDDPSSDITPLPIPQKKAPVVAADADPVLVKLKGLERDIYDANNYFQMFALPWNASQEQFKQKYMDLARDLHPDTYQDKSDQIRDLATDLFDRIREAWETLQDEAARQKYTDRVIHGKKTEEEEAMEKVQAYWAAEAEFKKGMAAFNQGRTVAAHAFFKAAVENCPDEYEFLAYYGYTLAYINRTKDPHLSAQGIELIQRVLRQNAKQDRKLTQGWVLLGRAWLDSGEAYEALRAFKRAADLEPSNKEIRRWYHRAKDKLDSQETPTGILSRVFNKKQKRR